MSWGWEGGRSTGLVCRPRSWPWFSRKERTPGVDLHRELNSRMMYVHPGERARPEVGLAGEMHAGEVLGGWQKLSKPQSLGKV